MVFFDQAEDGIRDLVRSRGDGDVCKGQELIHGTIEHIDAVDTEIKAHADNWTFERIAKVDLSVLRLAIYELLHRRDIPPIVSINEAIELGKIYSNPDSKRFINGILDQMKNKIDRPLRSAAD